MQPQQKNDSVPFLAYLSLALGVLFLSISPLFVRWANAPGVVTSFYRMLIVTIVLGAVALIRPKSFSIGKAPRIVWLLLILGGIFSGIDHALWSTSIGNTFVANATLLNYMAPLWVSLFAIFLLRERYAWFFWPGMAAVLIGAWIVTGVEFGNFSSISFQGEGFAILSSVFYAGYFIISQQAQKHTSVIDFMLISSAAAMSVLLIIILISKTPIFGYSQQTYLTFLIAGLTSQLGGYFSINYALRHLPATVVSAVLVLQPVITAILAIRSEGEGLSALQIIGGLLVIGGVIIVKAAKKDRPKEDSFVSDPA